MKGAAVKWNALSGKMQEVRKGERRVWGVEAREEEIRWVEN